MIGAWDNFGWKDSPPVPPSDPLTFLMAEEWLAGLAVEDWGCGTGWFKTIHDGPYVGVDGSKTPAVDVIDDLALLTPGYRPDRPLPEAILLRHVLEHNTHWEAILSNAGRSFRKRLAVILFTPWNDVEDPLNDADDFSRVLGHTNGIPDIALSRKRFLWYFEGLSVVARENLKTNTQYGVEHVFLVEKP